ncbi:hypothetical protein LT330_001141 [Penicillium expansum]|nr:hypothetical protein LT330_001141 [Penicillium expansum]
MAESDFEPFKPEIERLYIYENKTLREVMDYMASKYSFSKSLGQYARQLRKWGFAKGHIKADEWNWIGNKMNKRKLNDNKRSEFHIGGKEVHVSKLKKAKYRDAYVSTIARFSIAPSPKTPEGFSVCTPASPGMHLIWNSGSLPWQRFIKLVLPIENEEAPSPASSLTIRSPGADALSTTVNHELMHRLSKIIPWNKLSYPPNIHSSSRTSAALSILMPEEFPGQHDTLSNGLSSSTNEAKDRMALELFLLSNNIKSQDSEKMTERNMRSNDERVMQMLSDYGWKDLEHIQVLLSTREPTAEAIAERLFASALRLHDVDVVKMMLEAHMDPNNPLIETISDGVLTPLQFTAGSKHKRSGELVNLLISHGADVNYSGNSYPPLFYAISKHENRIIHALMFHGAIVTPDCLYIATYLKDIEVFEDITNSCSDVNARTEWQDISALSQAVKLGNISMIEILLARGGNVNALVSTSSGDNFGVTTILGIGAQSGSIDVIRVLLGACHEINPEFNGLPYVSPLVLAVQRANAKVTQTLLQAGVDIKLADEQGRMTLLERATQCYFPSEALGLCEVLIDHGAQVDRPVSAQKQESSALLIAVEKNLPELVELLICAGARLNDEYTKPPYTALGAAIEHSDGVLFNRLLAAGATFVGSRLEAIGSLRTAMYLQESGVLQGVLRVSGPRILAVALLRGWVDLAQYLLEHNADHEDQIRNEEAFLSEQITPLEAAIMEGELVFAEKLLARGAKVTDSVLVYAMSGNLVFLEPLLTRFCGRAPIAVVFALSGDKPLQLLELFQKQGVDPTGVPKHLQNRLRLGAFDLLQPESVLEIAVAESDREILQFLLQWTPWSPRLTGRALIIAILLHLDELAEDILPFDPDLTREITIEYSGRDFFGDVKIEQTYTPLEAAVNRQMITIVRALMEKVDVNYLGHGARCRTALQHAVEKENMELINVLISEHGARIDSPPATDGGATALQIACIKGYIGIARRLLDLGADVNEAPARYNGRTALQGAAEHGRLDMLQMLLDEGALIIGEGEPQYHRAVELAEKNGHYAAARMLRSWRDSIFLYPSAI